MNVFVKCSEKIRRIFGKFAASGSNRVRRFAFRMSEPQSTDRYEQFIALVERHERAIRGVVRSMLPSSQDADDVMQEVCLACWHKFADFDPDSSEDAFFRWACVVARFEVLKHRRKCARDRLVLSEETIQLLSADAEERVSKVELERRALEDCLGTLQPSDRRLILSIHVRGDSVAKTARQLGQNVRRLYSKVNVLRDLLGDCVRNKLADRGVT